MPDIKESDVIADVIVVDPDAHGDERGRFVETYRRSWFPLGREMTQANRSVKQAGAIVGLHYHLHQADYWYVLRGTARVVLHDLRQGSPTDGATLSLDLEGDHELIIGKVLDLGTNDGLPLLFFRRRFATLARHAGDGEHSGQADGT